MWLSWGFDNCEGGQGNDYLDYEGGGAEMGNSLLRKIRMLLIPVTIFPTFRSTQSYQVMIFEGGHVVNTLTRYNSYN